MDAEKRQENQAQFRGPGAAFLLAQLGAHAAGKFSERMKALNLSPAHAGILRLLARTAGITQQQLAGMLRMVPSRLVTLLDELEERKLTERREEPRDRRRYALHLTEAGKAALEEIGRVARDHQKELLKALSEEEQKQLSGLLERVAAEQGLTPGVHPGYGKIRRARK